MSSLESGQSCSWRDGSGRWQICSGRAAGASRAGPKLLNIAYAAGKAAALRERSARAASAANCTRMHIVQSDGRAKQWIKGFANTLRFSHAARSPPLFDLSSPNTESLNHGDAAFSARLMYSRWSAKPPGTGAHVASRRYQVIACTILCLF